MASKNGQESWIGVDFDRTLATYDGSFDGGLGLPVTAMVLRVKQWLHDGRQVRILTARVASCHDDAEDQREKIQAWLKTFVGYVLPVTAEKDRGMIELWDDNAVRVERNTGRRLSPSWVEED